MTRMGRPALLVSFATAFSLLGDQFLYTVLPTNYDTLGLLPIHVGILLSANRWVRFVTNPIAEWACRRWPAGLLMTSALVLGSLLTAVYATVHAFSALLAARVLWGLCWSFVRQTGIMTVVAGTHARYLGRNMGLYNGISRSGSLMGMLLGGIGHDLIGPAATLGIFALLSLLASPLGRFAQDITAAPEPNHAVPGAPAAPPAGLLAAGFITGLVGAGMIMSTLGHLLEARVGEGYVLDGAQLGVATLTGVVLGSRWLIDVAGAPILGVVSDWMGRRNAAFLFFVLGAAALIAVVPTTGAGPLIGGMVVVFICVVAVHVLLTAEAGSRGSRAVMLFVTAFDMGSATGPLIAWAGLHWGLPREAVLVAAGISFAMGAGAAVATFGWPGLRGEVDAVN